MRPKGLQQDDDDEKSNSKKKEENRKSRINAKLKYDMTHATIVP